MQQVGADGQAGAGGERVGEQGALIVAAFQQAETVQRHRGDQHVRAQQGPGGLGEPGGGEARDFGAVAVLQGEHQLAGVVAIDKGRAPVLPRAGRRHAVVALQPEAVRPAKQRRAAGVADGAADDGRVAPAGRAEAEVAFDQRAAAGAARRKQQANRRLKHPAQGPRFPP